ncbi:hypothetical protein DCAR_0102550 [Daucus carota subsp. sativus]|uniref:Uncharacterized protein n=1 Tax=Daucus carota subsp. sativus TaxID=79200 RepID=A0A169WQY1_DAUCS|nr:PREDICTED: uncharacterized protein DDB_G0284459-like [Daucus carota subsp. sativus]WOG83375.1 hypothetical protein DCAR_0102550 [Daucus carota subsp. sativus]
MGCRESKHIATGNTIAASGSSRKSTNRGQDGKKSSNNNNNNNNNNVQTLQKATSGRSSTLQKRGSSKRINAGDSKANNVLNENVKLDDEMKTDSGSGGVSEYCTPTEAAGAFDNTKTENAEEKKETVAEATPKENLAGNADRNLKNYMREAEVDQKIKEAEAAVANPGNHLQEAEVEEKIKEAEVAVEFLEKLVKETDKAQEIGGTEEATAGNRQNPVKENLEIPSSSVQNPEEEANKPEEIRETEVEATDATLQNPVEASDKSERNQNAGSASNKYDETLTKAGEAVEKVKEIHEVTEKAEELPVKEVETSSRTDQEALVSDEPEFMEKEAEDDYTTPEDPLKAAENADGENHASRLENTANLQSIEEITSQENPDIKMNTDDVGKQ